MSAPVGSTGRELPGSLPGMSSDTPPVVPSDAASPAPVAPDAWAAGSAPPPPGPPPPGWYPDPDGSGAQRWWDGAAWTSHRQAVPYASATGPFWVSQMGQEQGPLTLADLQSMARSRYITATTPVRQATGAWFPVGQVPGVFSDKEWMTTLLLAVFVGSLGADQFYLGNTGLGVAKLLTLGGCGIWALVDIIRVATNSVTDAQGLPLRR